VKVFRFITPDEVAIMGRRCNLTIISSWSVEIDGDDERRERARGEAERRRDARRGGRT
jgi:hypothetical protein